MFDKKITARGDKLPSKSSALSTSTPSISGANVGANPSKVAVKLGNGTILALSDLPPAGTTRWVASTKAAIVKVYLAKLISIDEVLGRYDLSEEEFKAWVKRYLAGGRNALKVTRIRKAQEAELSLQETS